LLALLLGILQGLTEFLPVSSSGHLAAARLLFGVDLAPEQALAFDISVHVATLAAVVIYFRGPLGDMLRGLAGRTGPGEPNPADERRLVILIVLTLIPTGLVFLFFKDFLEKAGQENTTLAIAFGVTALLLLATRLIPGKQGIIGAWGVMPWTFALLIGLAQGVALTPGISRSGATIAVALLLGLDGERAVRFSFLMAIPAILAAATIPFFDGIQGISPWILVTGMAGAFFVGLGSIHLLRLAVLAKKIHWFGLYLVVVSGIVLVAG
jgi:undecaprenyl-diphosphatase